MWGGYLRQRKARFLSFNAWETDFTGDPLVSFIGEMHAQITASSTRGKSKAAQYFQTAKKLAAITAKNTIPVGLKIATAGLLELDKLTESELATLAGKIAQEKIDAYESDKDTIRGFKKHLEEFIKAINADDPSKPLIVFIDELDRCRPIYALELLERVKHFFNVKGLIFVLGIDKSQLVSRL